jgi:hypothetical protein
VDAGTGPDPVKIPSAAVSIVESSLDKSDLEGNADCENGVVVEVCAADVLADPLAPFEKT